MTGPTEPLTCTRCGQTDRADRFRLSLVNRAREAREDGRPFTPPAFSLELRCRIRDECRARARREETAL